MKKVQIRCIPITTTPISADRKYLGRPEFYVEISEGNITESYLKYAADGLAPGKINMKELRAIIRFENGREMLIDSEGIVKYGKIEHYLHPSIYYYIRLSLTSVLFKSQGKEEIKIPIY